MFYLECTVDCADTNFCCINTITCGLFILRTRKINYPKTTLKNFDPLINLQLERRVLICKTEVCILTGHSLCSKKNLKN